jgi:hypothetical protein
MTSGAGELDRFSKGQMERISNRWGAWRSVCLTLVTLALALKVLVPPGFMLAESAGPPSLVICTGHGPLKITDPSQPSHHAPASHKSDAPCSGAGNVTPVAPAAISAVGEPYAATVTATRGPRGVDLAPGRGLAAPPPPSQASPLSLI